MGWAGMRYREQRGSRDLRLDLLRGAAMFAMITDHVGGQDSWLYVLTGGNRFFVSAAECFIFLSGLVTGLVYGSVAARHGISTAVLKILRRAVILYVLAVLLAVGLPILAYGLGLPWPQPLAQIPPEDFLISSLTLHRTYYLADILLLYALLFPGAGLALMLIAEGKTWLVLGGSWALWLLWQRWPGFSDMPWTIQDNAVFHLSAWQVLFFTALVMGVHRQMLAKWLSQLSIWIYLSASAALLAGSIALYLNGLRVFTVLAPGVSIADLAAGLFAKADVRIGRLVVFACLATFSFSLLTVAWQPIERAIGWLLVPLGQQSLSAFSLHLVVVALWTRFTPDVLGAGEHSAAQNALLQLSAISVVWLCIRLVPALGHVGQWLDQAEHALIDEAARVRGEAEHLLAGLPVVPQFTRHQLEPAND
ncbi:MAG: OpgC domain-containing protein [Chloroflexi bacterium]|nr:OpgC domain-containing protein [Chloroflexota bacterium]